MAGRTDFLYVADAKRCTQDNMRHIDRAGGRFVTMLPRNRQEDGQFRKWLQTNTPQWIPVWDRPSPRYHDGPRDGWFVYQPRVPSIEAWPVTWVWSTLLTLRHGARRQRCLAAATEELEALRRRLAQARARLRGARERGEFAVFGRNPVSHCLVLDGVYRHTESEPAFQEARASAGDELEGLLDKMIARLMKLVTGKGYLIEEPEMTCLSDIAADHPLASLQAASCTY